MLVRMLVRDERLAGSLGRLPSVLVSEIPPDQPLWERLGTESFDLLVIDRPSLPRPATRALAAIRALPDEPDVIVAGDDLDARAQARLLTAGALAVVHPRLGEDAVVREIGTLVERVRARKLAGLEASLGGRAEKLSAMDSASPAMRHLLELAARVARTDTTVLLLGETGAGKEWLARAIHEQGPRSAGPFLAVNCGAIPESLLETELFGHEEGAFTGAVRSHRGHFELAHGGTLFLDEVAEMPPHVQVKLLRVLQERTIRRVGGEREIGTDVRILAATNRDLEQEMRDGRFRADLFYRLGVVTMTIPPLRERREDIPRLVSEQIERFRAQLGHEVRGPSRAALEALTAYEWPGNVRELVNVVERALILCTGDEIGPADLPNLQPAGAAFPERRPREPAGDPEPGVWDAPLRGARDEMVERFEREYLSRALAHAGGRVRLVARRAGISERALYGKMRRYGLRKEDFRRR